MDRDDLDRAADGVLEAALLAEGWEVSLARLADAADVTGAVLMSYHAHRLKAALPSAGLAEFYDRFFAGAAPPCSRLTRIRLQLDEGFRVDHDDYREEEISRDPFYQEFAKPQGAFWNATAKLAAEADDWGVELSLKREVMAGPFDSGERAALDRILPRLRAAARIARRVFDVAARETAGLPTGRSDLVIELDPWGRVRGSRAASGWSDGDPVAISGSRLVAADSLAQPAVERALATALKAPGRPAATLLTGVDGRRYCLQAVPVKGRARDVFLATAALAIIIALQPGLSSETPDPSMLRDLFSFTDREVQTAWLLSQGLTLQAIARHLRIGLGTVRNHLKSAFEKSGTGRQAELVALMRQLP